MSRGSRISVSLSDDVIEEVERRRGLIKRSTYYESLIRSALGMELEENIHIRRRGIERRPIYNDYVWIFLGARALEFSVNIFLW